MRHPRLLTTAITGFLLAAAPLPALGDVAAGDTAYHTYCVSCHGDPPRGGAERATDSAILRNALNIVGAMQFLRNQLSTQQISDITAYIASLSAPPPPPGPIVPSFDYSDLWWNPNESGWGINLVQHASHKMFAVIYTYDTPRRPMWFVLPDGTWTSPTIYTGKIYSVTGFPGNMAFNSAGVKVTEVGNATFLFADQSHATINYSVNGVQVTKAIERQPF